MSFEEWYEKMKETLIGLLGPKADMMNMWCVWKSIESARAKSSPNTLKAEIAALADKMDLAVHSKNNFTMYEAVVKLRQLSAV